MEIHRAYASLGMPAGRYMLRFALPLVGCGIAVVLIFQLLLPSLFSGIFSFIFYAIPLFFFVLAVIYPYVVAEAKKVQIDNNIHFFITHMGVLATANIPRAEIIRMLSMKKEYGALAEESRKIFTLVDSWNLSLPESCRFVAKRTPSEIFADFLDRFAYAIESGEDMEEFLRNEQTIVINDYAAMYKGKLYEIEGMKNLFNSMMMAIVFIVLFSILMPVITGIDATLLLGGSVALVGFIQIVFVYFTKAKTPPDPMWHKLRLKTRTRRALRRTIPVSFAMCAAVGYLLYTRSGWEIPFIMAGSLTPLLYTGFRVGAEEERVKRRDDNFAAFIRSLGASTAARAGQSTEVLRHLRNHDFGALTENIKALYARLNLRVDDENAWRHFAAESGSNLIEKFSRMFIEGMKAGGKPDLIGRIISENFIAITTLRKSRYQAASAFRGMLYGLVAGMAAALFVGVAIVGMLQGIFTGMELPDDTPFMEFFNFKADIPFLGFLVILLLLMHSLASSMMVKIADGGAYLRGWVDLVFMFWLAAGVAHIAERSLSSML